MSIDIWLIFLTFQFFLYFTAFNKAFETNEERQFKLLQLSGQSQEPDQIQLQDLNKPVAGAGQKEPDPYSAPSFENHVYS